MALLTKSQSPTSSVFSMLPDGMRNAWMRKVLRKSQITSATAIDLIQSFSQATKPGFASFASANRGFDRRQREDARLAAGDRHRVLEVGRERAVGGGDGPPIRHGADFTGAEVDHRLDGDGHSGHQARPGVRATE